MEYRLVLLVFMLYIAKSRSMDPPTTCTTTADEVKWSTEIIDIPGIDDDGTLNLILPFTGNFDVSTPVGDDTGVKFIDASVEGENIVIKTNSYFTTNFDQDTASTTDAFVTIGRTINIICDGANYPLRLTLYVTDTNNNAPTFVATTYEYTMPMPLMPGIDLTSFGDQLIASDMDFSNQNMTFTIAPLDSFVLTTESLGNKQYRAILKVEQFTRFETDTVLTITATDEEGTKAGTATITIIKDGSASIPDPPTFSEVIYEYTYSEEAGVPTISPVDPTKEIVVTTNDPDNTAATITENNYVTAIYDTATGIVTIASSGTAIVSSEQVLTYTLTLTLNAESTQAAIIVKVPSDIVVSLPIFTQPYYTATYSTASDPHTVALDTNQVVAITEDSPTLQITLEGDVHFSISNVAGVWTLKADSNLEDTVLEKGDDIILTLTATVLDDQSNTYNGSGTVVIQLPEVVEVPRFDYPFYTGTYAIVEGGTDTVTLNHPINIANGVPEEVKISDSVNPYFEITKDTDAWKVTVTTNIPPPLTGGHIVLTLEATTTDSAVSGYGTLIINLPSAVQTLTFTKPFYKATYSTLVDPHTVILEEPIAIDEELPHLADLTIILEGDNHFSISNVGGVWTINVETNLGEDILNKGGDVVVTIHGTGTDDQALSYEGYGTVVITLPEVLEVPRFAQPTYTGTYIVTDSGNPDSVTLDNPINIAQTDETVDIVITDNDNFTLAQEGNDWTVKVATNLDPDVIQNGGSLILTLQATVTTGTIDPGFGTLIINLPVPVQSPTFMQSHYIATYEPGTSPLPMVDGTIQVTAADPATVTVAIKTGSFAENWTRGIGAFESRAEASKLINEAALGTPRFLEPLYNAEYTVDGQVTIIDGPINITDINSLPSLSFDMSYNTYFNFALDGDPQIIVNSNLDESIIKENTQIIVLLSVYIHGDTKTESTVIVITLPHVEVPPTLKFNQPAYTFSYDVDTQSVDQKGQNITLTNGDSNAVATIVDGPYKENFKVTQNPEDGTYKVDVTTPLDQDILDTEHYVLLVLDATLTDFYDAFTTVLIDFPEIASEIPPPQFISSSYTADYVSGQDNRTLTTSELISVVSSTGTPNVTLIGTHAENFNIVANSGNTGYDVVVVTDLDDATLIGEPDVVLTLQATVEGATTIGESTLVINLPKETAPAAFTQAMYTATYVANPDPATDVLTVQDPITISGNYMAETTVTLSSSEYTDYFILTGTNPTFNIQLQKDLDSPILTTVHEIVLTLEATLAGSTLKTTSTVVIQLPEVLRAPAFTNPIYTATYKVVETTATVTIDDPQINTGASDSTQASVNIKNTFTDNFVIEYVEASANYQITVSKLLDEDVVTNNVEIYLILSSTVTGGVDEQLATVALRMEKAADSVVPKFSDPFYYGTYTQNPDPAPDTITIPAAKLITIASDRAAETAVTAIDTYATNFQPNFDGTSWQITVAAKLDENTLSSSEIVVTLQADLPGSPEKGLATLILALPAHDDIAVPLFDHPLYRANYTVGTDGSPSFSSESIAIRSSQEELVTVTLDAYTANFVIARDDVSKTWTLSLGEPLGDDILKDYAELVITLTGQLDNAVADGTATLVVTLPAQSLSFDHSFYEGTYIHEATKADDVTIGTISVTIGAIVTIDGDHKDNFAITCTDGKCNLTTSGLSDDVLNAESEIILVVTATKPDVSATATATIIISLPLQEAAKAPEFTSPSYRATYNEDGGATVELPVPIQIKGMTDVTGLESIDLIGDYVDNFTITAEGDHFKIDTTGVPQTVIDSEIVIVLTMQAKKTGVTVAGEAALVIELPKKVAPSAIYFETSVYMGDYTDTDGVAVEKVIKLIGDDDHSATVTLSGENSALFENTYNTDGTVTISVVGDILPEAILNANAALTINIDATKGTDKVTAALVVTLPKSQNTDIVALTHVTYIATYSIVTDAADTVEVDNGPITIKDLTDFTNADIKIADDDAYKAYFSLTLDTDHWTLAITQDLEATTTDHETSLLVSLIATVNGISGEAGLVIKLPKTGVTSTLYFDDTVYMSDYDTVHSLVVEKDLTLQGNDDGTAALTFTGEHKDLFQAAYNTADKIVTITVPTAISQQILDDNAAISVGVVATKNPDTAEATLVVRLPKTQGVSSLSFTNLAYVGSYALNDENIGEVTIEGNPIQIVDVDQTTATLTIEDAAYQPYFSFSVDSDHWLVTVEENLPSSITDDDVSIFMTLKATVNDVAGEAGLVLKLPRKVVSTSFYFRDNTYNGEYMVYSSDNTSLVVEKPIQIDGDPDSTVNVTLSGDYAQYFTCLYENTQVAITILESLPSSIVDTLTLISVDLLGTKGEGTSKATLIVKLPEKTKPVTFFFDETTYMADYIATGTPTLGVDDDITLEGDSDGTATVTLNGDYKDNFEAAYNSGKITITLKSPLASDVVTSETAISLEIEASRDNEETKTTLVIKLPKQGGTSTSSSGSDTGLIAAVSVLAVLLVASLVGSAVFYYFKFRRGKNYSDLDEGRPSERFRKNENNPDTKRFEHPTRRATGVIKYPLTDEVAGESGTDVDLAEKRKSVQFDTINIDEREIEKSQDPEDDIEEQEEDEEHEEPENREEEAAEYENLDVDSDENEDIDIRRSSRV